MWYHNKPARNNSLLSSRVESTDNLLILCLPPPWGKTWPFYCPLSHSLTLIEPFITRLWTIRLRKVSINVWIMSVPVSSSTDCLQFSANSVTGEHQVYPLLQPCLSPNGKAHIWHVLLRCHPISYDAQTQQGISTFTFKETKALISPLILEEH